jgi:hypothetical protein
VKYCILFFILANIFIFSQQPAFSAEDIAESQIKLTKNTLEEDQVWPFSVVGTVIVALIGLVSGAIGSIIAPWANWSIEKKRKLIEYKHKLISDVRSLIDSSSSIEDILKSSVWGVIQFNLSEDEVQSIFADNSIHQSIFGVSELNMRKKALSEAIHKLEQRWQLST